MKEKRETGRLGASRFRLKSRLICRDRCFVLVAKAS